MTFSSPTKKRIQKGLRTSLFATSPRFTVPWHDASLESPHAMSLAILDIMSLSWTVASVRWIKSTRCHGIHPTPEVILNTPLHKKDIKRSQTCVTPLLNHGFWGCFSMFRIRTKGLTVDHSPIQSHWWPFRGAIPGNLGTGSRTILSNFLSE